MVSAPALLAKQLGAQSPIRVDFAFKQFLVAHSPGRSVQNDESGGAVEQHAVLDFGCVAAVVLADLDEAVEGIFGFLDFQEVVEFLSPLGEFGALSFVFIVFCCVCDGFCCGCYLRRFCGGFCLLCGVGLGVLCFSWSGHF